MEITLRARNCEVPGRVKDLARQKVEHATRFFDRILDLEVLFQEEANPRIPNPAQVEITARVKGHAIRAIGAGEDHHEAIDTAIARFERQLRRYKSRLVDRSRRANGDRGTHQAPELPEVHARHNGGDEPARALAAEPSIVRRKTFELTAMYPEDAILQLELLGHDFYLFTNVGTGRPNVIYRREDGDIGLIEGVPAEEVESSSVGAGA